MNARKIVTFLLLALVAASAVYFVVDGVRGRAASRTDTASNGDTALAATDRVIAYYFHGSQRCKTCLTIEAYTAEAIQTGFTDALSNGALEWKVVNIEEPANEHFVEDYQITTRTVVLVEMKEGKQVRWSALDRVWDLVGDQPAFMTYIQEETRGYLGS